MISCHTDNDRNKYFILLTGKSVTPSNGQEYSGVFHETNIWSSWILNENVYKCVGYISLRNKWLPTVRWCSPNSTSLLLQQAVRSHTDMSWYQLGSGYKRHNLIDMHGNWFRFMNSFPWWGRHICGIMISDLSLICGQLSKGQLIG